MTSGVVLLVAMSAAQPLKLGAPAFSGANVSPEVTAVASDHFAQQLSLAGFHVVTSREIGALLGFERQKALLGCTDSGCMVEISNALGVDGLVTGSIGRLGDRFVVNVKVLGARDGAQLALFSATVDSEADLPEVLTRGARSIAAQLGQASGAPPAVSKPRLWALLPLGVAIAAGAGGGIALGLAAERHQALTQQTYAEPDLALRARTEGTTFQTWGWVGVGVGAAALVAGGWLFASSGGEPTVSLLLERDGVGVGVRGTW